MWAQVTAHGGYRNYDRHLVAQRVRWAAIRARFLDADLREVIYRFNSADISFSDRRLFDWFFVGTSPRVGLCPGDVFGEIMNWWSL